MLGDPSPIRAVFCDDQALDDTRWRPAEAPCDLSGEADLDVERTEQTLQIGDPRLDLDDQDAARRRVEREQIDPPAVAIDVEAHLGMDEPAIALEPSFPLLGQRRVIRVEQAVELGAMPAEIEPR